MPTVTVPTKAQIVGKAFELWHKKNPEFDSEPELCEVKEEGFLSMAKTELLSSKARDCEQAWREYSKRENLAKSDGLPFDVESALASGFYIAGSRQLSGKTNLCKHLVKLLIDKGIIVFVVDPSLAWLRNSPVSQTVTVPKGRGELNFKRISTAFDVSRLGYSERFAFVKNLCGALTASHLDGYSNSEFVVFEESQMYFPNGCCRSKKYSQIVDFVTVGGNYGLSFGAITQFSASVDKAVVKLAQQRYFGLTTEQNDKQYVQSFIGKDWLREVVKLERGEFVYQCRDKIEKFKCGKFDLGKAEKQSFTYQYQYASVV